MTQPTPYRRGYDFSDAGGATPPGGPLDDELDDIGLTVSQILRNLALIQRDDTALRNGIVGIDALDSRVLGLISGGTFTIAGTWATATAYPAGAFFSDDEAIYLTMEAHTSTTIVDDLAAGHIVKVLQNEQGTRLRDDFTGNGVQTAFTLSQSPSRPSDVEVYVEGLLVPADDYAQTGSTVTFDVAPANGQEISIFSLTWSTTPPIQVLIDAIANRDSEITAATQFIADIGDSTPGKGASLVATEDGDVQADIDARPTSAVLAASGGAALVGFLQSGTDAVLRSISDKLLGFVDVLDFIPVNLHAGIRAGTNATDLTAYIQKAIDSLLTRGGTVHFPAGQYLTADTLTMRSGVSLLGAGRQIDFSGGVNLRGSWIIYQGATADPCLSFYGREAIDFSNMGILCAEASNQIAIFIGSDNAPAAKRFTFSNFTIVGADIAVKWGNANADAALEQCDDMTFSDGYCISCGDGFVIDAANAADYSKIERIGFENVKRTAFHMKKSAFIRIADCAAGLLFSTSVMFKLEGTGPDPVVISLCQSEAGGGKFLTYNPSGSNDQGQIILDGNVINQPVEVNGTARVLARGNFINSTISLTGYARWKSVDDVWDGVFGQPSYAQQVFVDVSVQFSAYSLKNGTSQRGFHLPNNFHIENGTATAGGFTGIVNTREGIYAYPYAELAAASFPVGFTVIPTADNGHAYIVTANVGAIDAEPAWPTGSGATVTSGGVTFQEIGTAALMKGYGAIAA